MCHFATGGSLFTQTALYTTHSSHFFLLVGLTSTLKLESLLSILWHFQFVLHIVSYCDLWLFLNTSMLLPATLRVCDVCVCKQVHLHLKHLSQLYPSFNWWELKVIKVDLQGWGIQNLASWLKPVPCLSSIMSWLKWYLGTWNTRSV